MIDALRTLEVVTASEQSLVTLEVARDELGTKRADDGRVRRYIQEASSVVATYTRRVWRQETVTEVFHQSYFQPSHFIADAFRHLHGHDHAPRPIMLSRYPVIEVSALTDGEDVLAEADYLLNKPAGLIHRFDATSNVTRPWSGLTLSVTYTGGYLLADVPPDVQQGCLTLMRHRYSARGRDPMLRSIDIPGVQSEAYWVGAQGENGAVPPEVAGLLAQHIDMRS